MQQQLSDTLRTDDGRPLSPINPGTPHSQDDNKNKSMRQLRNVVQEDMQAKKNREKEERLQRSIQATLKKLSQKVDKSVMFTDSQQNSKRLSKNEFQEDRDHSPGTSPRRQRPARPNRFWKNNSSSQKQTKLDPPNMLPQNQSGDIDEPPRATKFPDIEDFLNKSPEEPSHLSRSEKRSMSPTLDLDRSRKSDKNTKKSPPKQPVVGDFQKQFEENFNQKPQADEDLTHADMTHNWNEEDNNRSDIIMMPLNKAEEDSMEFDDGLDDDKTDKQQKKSVKPTPSQADQIQGLTISMENLLGTNKKPPTGRKQVPGDDRDTMKGPEHSLFKKPPRASRRGRDSKKPHDIQTDEQYPDALFDFFKCLDYNPNNVNQGTVRASYRSGRTSYNIYGVPAKKPGEKSQVFIQSQDGFDRDMPPVRLSGEQTAQLVSQFKELDQLESLRQTLDEEAPDEDFLGQNNLNQKQNDGSPKLDFSLLQDKSTKIERKVPTPSKEKHVRAAETIQRDNKTFWSSGYERSIPNQPKVSKINKKQMPGIAPISSVNSKPNFLNEFEKTMATQSIPSEQIKDMNTSADDNNTSKGGISLKNIVYNVGSSVFGGFGTYSQSSREPDLYSQNIPQTKASEPKNRSNIDQTPGNKVMLEETQRSKTPGGTRNISPSRRPKHSRFNQQPASSVSSQDYQPQPVKSQRPPEQVSSPKRLVYSPPHERNKANGMNNGGTQDPYFTPGQPQQFHEQYPRPNDQAAEASVKSAKSYRSPRERSQDGKARVSPSRAQRDPKVFKLTPDDVQQTPQHDNGQYPVAYKGNPYDYKPPQVNKNNYEQPKEPMTIPRSAIEDYMEQAPYHYDRNRIDSNFQQVQSAEPDPSLPNVILLVADNVKLIRNNSVPLLQVQVEIIQNAMLMDNDMCMLGLNDVIYIVPEFNPSDYDTVYPRLCTGNEFEDFGPFFEHYKYYSYNPSPLVDNIPERMMGLHKNSMTAIERDHYEPDLRGRAFINLKHVPNGHYTIFHLRIGQPISINSRLKVLGRAKGIFVNINREKISLCKKPQLDLNHSSSRISKRETSKFKIMKAKNNKKRDNKVMLLNSDDEDDQIDEEQPTPQEKKVDEDFKKMFNTPQDESQDKQDEKENKDTGLEMEFDDGGQEKEKKSKMQPAPLQDSKDYYNSTQRMTDAMIQNPQFQLFSIDEEESVRTSMRESEDDRKKVKENNVEKFLNTDLDVTPHVGTPPAGSPEDAFRNVHRQFDKTKDGEPVDPISKKIEDYQRESLAQLANLQQMQQMYAKPDKSLNDSRRMVESAPKEPVREYVPPQQRERRNSVQSRGSAGSRNSMRSDGSGRKSTRVKTINLRELTHGDDEREQPQRNMAHATPGQGRQRSRSLTQTDQEHERDTLQHPQYNTRQRSPSQKGPLSPGRMQPQQQQDQFTNSIRETAKLDVINLNQQRPLNQPSIHRQHNMVQHFGRKEDRSRSPMYQAPQQQPPYQQPHANKGYPAERSRSPLNMIGQQAYTPQDGPFSQPNNGGRHPPGQPEVAQRAMPQGAGSRPWKRDRGSRSRGGRSESGRSVSGDEESNAAAYVKRVKADVLNKENQRGRASPARAPLRFDRYGNPLNPHDQSNMDNSMNTSMRSNNSNGSRPGSASKLHDNKGRNRFFSPQAQKRDNGSRSRSQDRHSNQGQFLAQHPTPNQLLNPNMMPVNQNGKRNPSQMSEENFSDENHSPVRPMGQVNALQSGALRQQHQGGTRHKFGNSITGSITNGSGSGVNPALLNQSYGSGMGGGQYGSGQPAGGVASRNFRSPNGRISQNNSWNLGRR